MSDQEQASVPQINLGEEVKWSELPSELREDILTRAYETMSAKQIDKCYGLLDVHGKLPGSQTIQRKATDPVTLFGYAAAKQTPESLSFHDFDVAKHRFNCFSGNIFESAWRLGLPIVVAGGSILRSLSKVDSPFFDDYELAKEFAVRDFDVWFCSEVTENVTIIEKMLKDIEEIGCHAVHVMSGANWSNGRLNIEENVGHVVIEFNNKFGKIRHRPFTRLDFILRRKKSILDLLTGFDLDCVRFAYDGRRFYTTKTGLSAFKTKENQIHRKDLEDRAISRLMYRTLKYAVRGYSTKILDAPGAAEFQASDLQTASRILGKSKTCLQQIIWFDRYISIDFFRFIKVVGQAVVTNYQESGDDLARNSLDRWYAIRLPNT